MKNFIRIVDVLMALNFLNKIIPGMEETPEKNKTMSMLKWEHFSSWSKLIYHVAALLKIKNNWLLWTKYKYTTKSYLTSLKLSQKVKNCSANVKKNVI